MSQPTIPLLAQLIRQSAEQQEVISIYEYLHLAKDISNAYLVNTDDGDVMINTGFMSTIERNQRFFDGKRTGPLRAIFLNQAHPDHYGGVPAFAESDTQIIAGQGFTETWQFFHMLDDFLRTRSGEIWATTIQNRTMTVPEVIPTLMVNERQSFDIGGRTFEVIPTPGGESPDAVVIWMPKEKIVFCGNLFGPIINSVPNLCTMRGDKPRSAKRWLAGVDTVRRLGAEMLFAGHTDPIKGADGIRNTLDRMYNAVLSIHDQTVAGMNAGKDVHTLMREIKVPEEFTLGEYHGKVNWAVRTIWEEYAGWFHMDSTTSLYDVPASSVAPDIVRLAGASALCASAQQKAASNNPLEALHLIDIVLNAEPSNADALAVKKQALGQLIVASGGDNMSEVMWLRTQMGKVDALLGNAS
jgi:alkyl sulfatase BDS1-like metallo-beta-lactamase superfamily hydrolase